MIAFSVGMRQRELAIRMALGARRTELGRLTSLDGLKLSGMGIVMGVPVALVTARFTGDLFYDIGPSDGLTLLGTAVVLLLLTSLATYLPSRKAMRLSPSETLKAS